MSMAVAGVAASSSPVRAANVPPFGINPVSGTVSMNLTMVTPSSSDAFVDSVGVDSHFGMVNEPYVSKFSLVAPQLVESGIRHLRDAGTGTNYDSRMAFFYAHGITHSLSFPAGTSAADMATGIAASGGEADAVEGPNEYDIKHHTQALWTANLRAMQRTLYDTAKSTALGKTLTVLGPPLADANYYSLLGNMDSLEDAGSIHESSCDYNPGTTHSDGVANWILAGRISSPLRPIWTTEAGYTTDLTRPCSVPQDVAAKYDTRLIAQYWNDGGARLYFYQLVDIPDDAMFGGKGLIDQNGRPKLQFTAISSFLTLLADKGPAVRVAPIAYSITGQTADVETTLLARRDGSYEMLIWQEVPSWDHDTRQRITVRPQTVRLTFRARPYFAHFWTFDNTMHLVSRALPITGPTISVPVTDSISVLHFR